MAKTCPSCGYRPIGPFTDNCPICAEPVRNVRSDRGGSGRASGMPPWAWWLIGGVLAAVLAVAACCGLGMWRMGKVFDEAKDAMERAQAEREADRKARTVVVAAADLLKEFETDPLAADRKYSGKYLELTGVVERTGRDRNTGPFVILHAGDANAKVKVECYFEFMDDRESARVMRLEAGQTVTVRGEYDRHVSNVQLRECVLVK